MYSLHFPTRRLMRFAIGTLALASCLGLTCCSKSAASDDEVASLGDAPESTTTPADGSGSTVSGADREDALLEYAKCMRDHGIDMPDPKPGSNGAVIELPAGAGEGAGEGNTSGHTEAFDPTEQSTDPKLEAAGQACQPILKGVFGDAPQLSAEDEAKARDFQLAFTRCMRDNGVDLPDPDSGGALSGSSDDLKESGIDLANPEFVEAAKRCQAELGDRPGSADIGDSKVGENAVEGSS